MLSALINALTYLLTYLPDFLLRWKWRRLSARRMFRLFELQSLIWRSVV